MTKQQGAFAVVWVCLALAACQPGAPASSASAVDSGIVLPVSREIADSSELLRLAAQALQQERLYAPQGDNAVEFYLAARDRAPDDAAIHTALIELQPYVLIATEQAVERGDVVESRRLLALMQRLDPRAPALARLHDAVQGLEQTAIAQDAELAPVPVMAAPAASPRSSERVAESITAAATPSTPVVSTPPAISETDAGIAPLAAAPAVAVTRPVPREIAPRLLQDAQPRYPLPALRNRIEGHVDVAFVIRPDGSVGDVRLVSAQPQGVFDASALAVAQRWRFEASDRSHAQQRTVQFRLPVQ